MSTVYKTFILPLIFALLTCSATQLRAETFNLDMRDVDLREFIQTIGKLTGKTIVVDSRVKGKVDIQSPKPLTQEEIYQIFLAQLGVNGFSAVEVTPDIIKVIPDQSAKLEGIDVQTKNTLPARSERLITRIVQVDDVNVDKLVATLRPLVDNKSGVIAAYSGSNVIMITDRESNVRRIVNIIREVDHADAQILKVITLKFASAEDVQRLLSKLIEQQSADKADAKPMIVADTRTNALIIRADQTTQRYLEDVIVQLDTNISTDSGTRVVYLKYAKAEEIASLLKGVSSALVAEEKEGKTTTSGTNASIHIEAHEQTNSVVMSGSPQMLSKLDQIIRKLDIRRAQVLVEAIIVELTDDRSKELGMQWLFYDSGTGEIPVGTLNNASSSGASILGIASAAATGNATSLSSLASSSAAMLGFGSNGGSSGFSFLGLLTALATDTESNVLSTPSLLTMDNEEASIVVGSEVPIITGSTVSSSNSNPYQTITRKDIGVKLTVTPQINDGDTVQLTLEQEVSSLSGATSADIITNKREVKTTVLVDNRTTIVLGGLIDEDVQESSSKVPLLGDIPYLGRLFRSDTTTRTKRNLMVFIRPTIIENDAQLEQASLEKYRYIRAMQIAKQERGTRLMGDIQGPLLPEWPATQPQDPQANTDAELYPEVLSSGDR